VDNEVDLFLSDTSTKLSSLKKYPTLKQLFLKYNATLPSSASVERLFSIAGRIFVPLRNGLSDQNFEKLLFLKANKHF
jgi:transcriptional/translational regulatory protein YebC/TACO1